METGVELHSIRADLGQPETIQRKKQAIWTLSELI